MAIRAASIWREVRRPGSMHWRPKSPKATFEPRQAMPRLLPFCIFRYLVRFGESIFVPPGWRQSSKARSAAGSFVSGDAARLSRQDLAFEHPHFDADDAVGRLGFGGAELDVGAQRV